MTETTQSLKPSTAANEHQTDLFKTPWLVLFLPLVLFAVILFVSPNFQSTNGVRSTPFGSDFLQEWVGAKTFAMDSQARLYDPNHFKTMQHDGELVGFEWTEEKYFPMVYPPFYYQLLQPFSWLSYPNAAKVWGLLGALAFSLTGFMLYRFYPPCRANFTACIVLALFFVPVLTCLNMNQKSTWLLLILTGTFLLLYNERPLFAGVVFGLLVFKPHLGIVICLVMLLKRQWKFVFGAALVAISFVAFSWIGNQQLCLDYVHVVLGMGDYVQTGGYDLADSHSLWGATQLTFSQAFSQSLATVSPEVVKVLTISLSLVVIGLLVWSTRGEVEFASSRFARQFSAMVIATALLSPHFYSYDLTILLLPMLLALVSLGHDFKQNKFELALVVVMALLFFGAGFFNTIASTIHVQLSIVLMVATLVLLGCRHSWQAEIVTTK